VVHARVHKDGGARPRDRERKGQAAVLAAGRGHGGQGRAGREHGEPADAVVAQAAEALRVRGARGRVYVHVCVHACVRAHACVCVCVCVRAWPGAVRCDEMSGERTVSQMMRWLPRRTRRCRCGMRGDCPL